MGLHHGQANFITYGTPKLLLNFSKNKSLLDRISKNNINFTRGSIGTYVGADGLIKYAAADEPRFDHDPATGESLGLLIEESRTNLITQSSTNWVNNIFELTNVDNQHVSPDGTTTASDISETTTNSQHYATTRGFLITSGSTYTFSFFAKNIDRTSTAIQITTGGGWTYTVVKYFTDDINATQVLANSANAIHTKEKYGNGWYRFTLTLTATSTTNSAFYVDFRGLNGGVGSTNSMAVWGFQMEAGSFPTSYIPTSGSTVTRLQDNASVSNYSIGNITQGTFVFDGFNLRGRNADSTTDPDEIGVFATFSGTNGENRILTDDNYYISNSSADTQTITSGQANRDVITNTPTFTSGVNRIFISHNVFSTLGSQIRWNFTDANGLPTEVGTVLFLEIYSKRYNSGPSGSRGHYSAIMFNGSTILTSGYEAVAAGATYERAVRKIVILTESGWEEYQNSPSITTGETASYAYSFEYDGTNTITKSMKSGILTGGASYSGLKLPTDPVLNLNFNPSARTYKRITLYPSVLSNSQLQNLTR
jgi:hypothetical protein